MSNANQVLLLAHPEVTYGVDPDDDGPETDWFADSLAGQLRSA